MPRLSLRFEKMPERHAELAWRFGEPDECRDEAAPEREGGGARWTLVSPLPPEAGVAAQLGWASECLRPHEAFVGELISLGGRVVLRLECAAETPELAFAVNARLLLPMAHTGVLLEFHVTR